MNNNEFASADIQSIISGYFTRYNVLDNLIPYAFKGSKATELNIYVDIYSIYRSIFSRNFRTKIENYTDFTSCIIDLCVHYRVYFKYIGVHTKFFLINSFNLPEYNLSIYPEYNKVFTDKLKNKYVYDVVNLNIELLNILCPYLPDIHFLSTKYESTVLMNEIINREGLDKTSLIITSDIYPLQLNAMYDNVSLLWPRKYTMKNQYTNLYQSVDNSIIVCPKTHPDNLNSFWSMFIHKHSKKALSENVPIISPSNFALVESLNGCKERYFNKCILNISSIMKSIYSIIGDQNIVITPDTYFESVKTKLLDEQKEEVRIRYNCLSLQNQLMLYDLDIEKKTIIYENLHDPNTIQLINSKYFANNPINILDL